MIQKIQKEIKAKFDKPDMNKYISHYLYLVDYTLKFRIRLVSENSLLLRDEVLLSSVDEIPDISYAVNIETFKWTFSLLVSRETNEVYIKLRLFIFFFFIFYFIYLFIFFITSKRNNVRDILKFIFFF